MDHAPFIILAYAISGTLIALLCLTSWLRARAVNRQMRTHHEP